MTMNTTPDPIAGTPPDRLDIDGTTYQFRHTLIATGALADAAGLTLPTL